jgi:hypothetical protein
MAKFTVEEAAPNTVLMKDMPRDSLGIVENGNEWGYRGSLILPMGGKWAIVDRTTGMIDYFDRPAAELHWVRLLPPGSKVTLEV